MDRRYSAAEIDAVGDILLKMLVGYPAPVADAIVLGCLVERLKQYRDPERPDMLRELQVLSEGVRGLLLELCAEGPYEGLPVA